MPERSSKTRRAKRIFVIELAASKWSWIGFNKLNPPFQDKRAWQGLRTGALGALIRYRPHQMLQYRTQAVVCNDLQDSKAPTFTTGPATA